MEVKKQLSKISKKIKKSTFADFGIGKIVVDELYKMMENNGDTRKTAENIYDRIWIYYNE